MHIWALSRQAVAIPACLLRSGSRRQGRQANQIRGADIASLLALKECVVAGLVIWFIALASMFYFLIVRPQKKRVVMHQRLLADLEVGDNVVTSSGIYGTIKAIEESKVDLEVAEGVSITLAKSGIAQIDKSQELVAR